MAQNSALAQEKLSLLRFCTMGSVDDGKSTLIGRLLLDSGNLFEDQLAAIQTPGLPDLSPEGYALAYVTDGLREEREQGITIDVAYRYFSAAQRRFILADTPGHVQYTKNMATGASTADLALLVVDAARGVSTQTRRHAFVAALLGVPRFLVAVNKMDLIEFSADRFNEIKQEFSEFAARLGLRALTFVPVSALQGENVVRSAPSMPWYRGETIYEHLTSVFIEGDRNVVDFRFPVQRVIRGDNNYRGYAGTVVSGKIRVGDEIVVVPSFRKSRVVAIDRMGKGATLESVEECEGVRSVTLRLADEIDIGRGDMIVRARNVPHVQSRVQAMLVWLDSEALDSSKQYLIQHTSRSARARIETLEYVLDVDTLHRRKASTLQLNEIGRVELHTSRELCLDPYSRNRATGSFILIDPDSCRTVGAGMAIDRIPEGIIFQDSGVVSPQARTTESSIQPQPTNLHGVDGFIHLQDRESRSGIRAQTVWLTGLSGSGKSTIAAGVEQRLFELRRPVFRLDGDVLRKGLNSDLGFSAEDRDENIRRAAEVAKLFNEAGIIVLCAFITPFQAQRDRARAIIGEDRFLEVYVATPLEVCESRDPHHLYQKARRGEIPEFTGISSPYEPPLDPQITLDTNSLSEQAAIHQVVEYLLPKLSDSFL